MIQKFTHILLILCIFNATLLAQEQPKSDLVFNKFVHDFGDVLLSSGPMSCTFTYTNKGNKPIVIQYINTSCGCTEPKWDKAPIMPGKSGTIAITFSNDQGPYPFDKTIGVYSTASDLPIMLRIRGVVHEKKKSLSELFPIAYASLRLRSTQYDLGPIAQGEVGRDSAQVVNAGKSPIEISFTKVDAGLDIDVYPKKLKAGEKGYIRYTVDTRRFIDWGTVTYTAQLLVNGKSEGGAPMVVTADIRENFRDYTQEQRAQAPILLAEQTVISFEQAKQGDKVEKSFTISNKGRTPLIIRKVTPAQTCVTAKAPTEIAPGKSATVTLTLDTSGLWGEVATGVTLVTNVPTRPVISLIVTGYVVP